MNRTRRHASDLRALARLAVTATTGVTDAVEAMHQTIASGPSLLGKPLSRPVRALIPLAYGPVRGVTRLVGAVLDRVLAQLDPLLGESAHGAERDAIVAVLNGAFGDYLVDAANPLAIEMRLRSDSVDLPLEPGALLASLPAATPKLLVLVHGSSMSDHGWNRGGHDHGAALARDLGYTPVYVRYNSGLHVSTSGRALSGQLEALVKAWPVPLEEVSLLGHSMGGLVARSACHAASREGHTWPRSLLRLVCLGSPHHGSPLERGGDLIGELLGVSEYSAPLARLAQIRSAGVTDLRYGNVLDEDWVDRGRFGGSRDVRRGLPLPVGVACFAVAGTRTQANANATAGKLLGDGLVPVDSALGRHERPELTLAFPPERQWVALGTGHVELLSSRAVYEKLREWFAERPT